MELKQKVPEGYKQTDAGQIIPKEWIEMPLNEIGRIERGKFTARPRNDPKLYGGEIPFIQTGDITKSNGKITDFSQTLNQKGLKVSKLFPKGTLFFTIAANIGDVALTTFDAACPDSVVAITPKAENYVEWLLYELATRKKSFEAIATQNAQSNLNLDKMRPYLIRRPPRPEQQAIAEALADCDALIDAQVALIAKKRLIQKGTMQRLLTGQKRLPGFERQKGTRPTELGDIPLDWEVLPLGLLGEFKGGGTPSMSNQSYWSNGTIHWMSSGDVKQIFIRTTPAKITSQAVKETSTALIPTGAITVVMRSGILRKYFPVTMNLEAIAINQDLKSIITNDHVIPLFLLFSLVNLGPEILKTCLKSGTTVESIELAWLRKFPIILPDPKEQKAIAEVLSDMDREIEALETQLAKLRRLKRGMMQQLLTGRKRLC